MRQQDLNPAKWALGYAKAEPGKLLFQAKTGVTGSVAGPVEVYSELRLVSQAEKAPWTVFPKGSVIVLSTRGALNWPHRHRA